MCMREVSDLLEARCAETPSANPASLPAPAPEREALGTDGLCAASAEAVHDLGN